MSRFILSDEAVNSDFGELWQVSIDEELANLADHDIWEWCDLPRGRRCIDTTWRFRAKPTGDGYIDKLKSRLCARGFKQVYGIDYCDSSSPVGKLDTFRILVAEAANTGKDVHFLDIKSAYLTADLKIKQYMTAPEGVTPPEPDMVMQIEKGLYGLVQGARAFHLDFRAKLLSWGYKASAADPCLFVRRKGKRVIRILLFVDDMAIFTDRSEAGKKLKTELIALRVCNKRETCKWHGAHT